MPKRNLLLVCLMTAISLVAWLARDHGTHGRRVGEVMGTIERSYLEPVDADMLSRSAIEAVFSKLDEHSAFIDGDDRERLETALDQEFGGVGLELKSDEHDGTIVVHAPLPNSPAWRAGMLSGETILAIDGRETRGMPVRDAVKSLRGAPGTSVAVLVQGADAKDAVDTGEPTAAPRLLTLVRERVRTESVLGDRRRADGSWEWFIEGEPGVALIRITAFGDHTLEDLDRALAAIAADRPRGLILDLRGNPGGLLAVAVAACDRFLDEGVIVSTRGRGEGIDRQVGGLRDVRRATKGSVLAGVPIAVMVDGLTASAAEVVAACLQDHGRAVIVGSRTFGKGTVQSILPLSDGKSLVKLTTAEYLRPSQAAIHRGPDDVTWGVSPAAQDEIDVTAEKLESLKAWRRKRDAVRPLVAAAADSESSADLPRHVDAVLAHGLSAVSH